MREQISTNYSIISLWRCGIEHEEAFIRESGKALFNPLPKFKVDFWDMILQRMPLEAMRNQDSVNHMRLLCHASEELNDLNEARMKAIDNSNSDRTLQCDKRILEKLTTVFYNLEELDKRYLLRTRFGENEKRIFKSLSKKRKFQLIPPRADEADTQQNG